jgi:LPXTG-motif cell wall-anchored protein
MKSGSSWMKTGLVLAIGTFCISFAGPSMAQVQTKQETTSGAASKEVTVERGEVVLVEGNDLIVKMDDGTIRHIANVPESATVTVDGKQLGIHDLKPGMKLQRTITTTSRPQTVTTVQTVTGKVWHVTPPNSVILRLENNTNQSFKIPKGQKFNVNGQMVDAFGLKKGMLVTATKIVEVPEILVSQQKHVTGTMPAPPAAPPADVPILIAREEPTPVPAVSEAPAAPTKTLPKTGSQVPLIGLLGLICLSAAFAVKFLRANIGV